MEHEMIQFLLTGLLPWMILIFIGICTIGEIFEKEFSPYIKSGIHTVQDLKKDGKRKKEEKERRAKNGRRSPFYLEEDYKKKERMGFLIGVFAVTLGVLVVITLCQGDAMEVWESSKSIERLLEAVMHLEILTAARELLLLLGSILLTLFSFFALAGIIFICWGFALTLYNRYQEKKGLYKMETTEEWRNQSCKKE
jgi:hypothetical protein